MGLSTLKNNPPADNMTCRPRHRLGQIQSIRSDGNCHAPKRTELRFNQSVPSSPFLVKVLHGHPLAPSPPPPSPLLSYRRAQTAIAALSCAPPCPSSITAQVPKTRGASGDELSPLAANENIDLRSSGTEEQAYLSNLPSVIAGCTAIVWPRLLFPTTMMRKRREYGHTIANPIAIAIGMAKASAIATLIAIAAAAAAMRSAPKEGSPPLLPFHGAHSQECLSSPTSPWRSGS
eukprot:TRINITY_DN226_c0_g1_i4.p1 TRINITY_DN226_c0_g1~~TRINITY_DN226_c0_g1_i4.p1  ORF type:complete len:233 (-),score=22.22 TRINITY_DN226_c0_g1_i4:257-955(-)